MVEAFLAEQVDYAAGNAGLGVARTEHDPRDAGMHPRQEPYRPTVFELHRNGRLFPPNYLHDSWLDYLYWDTALEP